MQSGDKNPSQLLQEMQDLSLGKTEGSVTRMLWCQRPPITTQQILSASFGRLFNWNFIVADVSRPILGADVLERYGFLVDIKNKKLIYVGRNRTTRGHLSFGSSLGITVLSGNKQFHKLLSKFPNLTNHSLNIVPNSHGTTHCILTKGPPVLSSAKKLTPEKLKAVKKQFINLVAQCIFHCGSTRIRT
ncbi:hypothetical protein AVEN_57192-1 [Araneus ventricosus]|uniref:Uncharacterized protein n=1 Tax=Araneus ventricosus TaxID=182803 RepID=A0A4Y2RAB8_ARAVE|nr:hypothetical protein AVEN_57192-1 [Araneus ventricosus]